MSSPTQAAYLQIKALENNGGITLPAPQGTVEVGTLNLATGAFTWTVPTVVQSIVSSDPAAQKPINTVVKTTIGVVDTNVVDLLLHFTLTGGSLPANPSITVTGFPLVSVSANSITLDAGMFASGPMQTDSNTDPPVTTAPITITIPGTPELSIEVIVMRPPVLGIGAFTLPTVPVAIVYAPPQGADKKNSSTYQQATAVSRALTTSIVSTTNTKIAPAFTTAGLISQLASTLGTIAAAIPTAGAGASAGGAVGGIVGSILTALVGNPDNGDNDNGLTDTVSGLKSISSQLNLVSTIFNSVSTTSSTSNNTIGTQDDNTVTTSITLSAQFGSQAGLPTGDGDRIIYMQDVRIVWFAQNGDVGINVLDQGTLGAESVATLKEELASLAAGKSPSLGLDAASLQRLLALDPFASELGLTPFAQILPPRYTFAYTIEGEHQVTGGGTAATGDPYQVILDTSTEDKNTQLSTSSAITDAKPGFTTVLLGGSNDETTTTMTFTNNTSDDEKTDQKITNTVTMFSQGDADLYDISFFNDILFTTLLPVASTSSLVTGVTEIGTEEAGTVTQVSGQGGGSAGSQSGDVNKTTTTGGTATTTTTTKTTTTTGGGGGKISVGTPTHSTD